MAKNYYAVLGIASGASDAEIRRRFKQLAREKHPDRFQGEEKLRAEREFQAITEAINTLTDPERRRRHDVEISSPGNAASTPAAAKREEREQTVKAYLARGVRAYKEGDYKTAAASFEQATELDPHHPQAWFNLALTLSRRQRWVGRALAAAESACALEPMKPAYLKLAGRLSAENGRVDEATRFYKEALTWGGADPEVDQALVELHGERKERRGFFGRVS